MKREKGHDDEAIDAGAPPAGVRRVGLDSLEPAPDSAELSVEAGSEPGADSPGDASLLEQEEQYLGIASDQLPSDKQEPKRRDPGPA